MDIKFDKNKTYIETAIGPMNTEIPEGYVCKEIPGMFNEDKLIIKSALTKVIVQLKNKDEEIIEPILMESCMNPGVKTIIPIVYEEYIDNQNKKSYNISTPYKKIESGDVLNAKTENYIPMIKKNSCTECRNCGRC